MWRKLAQMPADFLSPIASLGASNGCLKMGQKIFISLWCIAHVMWVIRAFVASYLQRLPDWQFSCFHWMEPSKGQNSWRWGLSFSFLFLLRRSKCLKFRCRILQDCSLNTILLIFIVSLLTCIIVKSPHVIDPPCLPSFLSIHDEPLVC